MTTGRPYELEYARGPARWRAVVRRMVWWAAIVAVVAAGVWWGPAAGRRVELLYWQGKCLRYAPPADQVVYEERAGEVEKLLGRPGYGRYVPSGRGPVLALRRPADPPLPTVAAAYRPPCWEEVARLTGVGGQRQLMAAAGGVQQVGPIVFLGRLRTPSGKERLVAVEYTQLLDVFQPQLIRGHNYEVFVLEPVSVWRGAVRVASGDVLSVLCGPPRRPPDVRIYAGQVDPADPGHFTVRYEMWGQEDVADGRIDDRGQVFLMQRKRPTEPER